MTRAGDSLFGRDTDDGDEPQPLGPPDPGANARAREGGHGGGESQEASSRERGPHLLAGGTATGHAGHTLGPMIQEKGPHTVPERPHQMTQSQEHVAGAEGCGAEGHVGGCIRDHGGRGGRRWGARTF